MNIVLLLLDILAIGIAGLAIVYCYWVRICARRALERKKRGEYHDRRHKYTMYKSELTKAYKMLLLSVMNEYKVPESLQDVLFETEGVKTEEIITSAILDLKKRRPKTELLTVAQIAERYQEEKAAMGKDDSLVGKSPEALDSHIYFSLKRLRALYREKVSEPDLMFWIDESEGSWRMPYE